MCACVCARAHMCVVVISEHMCRWLLHDHTPTGACECPLADRHTHVAEYKYCENIPSMPADM